MRVLIFGANGQLGTELAGVFADAELHLADLDGDGLIVDIRSAEAVRKAIGEVRPALVINCAAAHNLPECEAHPSVAFGVNATGCKILGAACKAAGARVMHVSTDYIFSGEAARPYVETDLPAPLNIYAASKLAGEHLLAAECPDHLIVRTAAMYGHAECRAKGGRNFVTMMLHLAATRPEVKVVSDEFTTPTYTLPLAKQMRLLAEKAEPGIYHATCEGACSWYEFAKAIFEETGTEVNLQQTTSSEFQSPVRRPRHSVMQNKHAQDLGLDIMPPWRDALKSYLSTLARA